MVGLTEFFSHPLHVLDLLISIASLTIEAVLVESSGAYCTIDTIDAIDTNDYAHWCTV